MIPDRNDTAELVLEVEARIDAVCLEFENAWRDQEGPRIEDYLWPGSDDARAPLFRQLLAIELEYLGPGSVSPDQYKQRFQDLADVVDDLVRQAGEPTVGGFQPGERVGRYTVERLIGQGGFARVYVARDDSGRTVAIKSFHPDAGIANGAADESTLLSQLDHPRIVKIHELVRDPRGAPAIVMQYVTGESLHQRLEIARFSQVQTVDLLIQVAEAIHYAHQRGIVHRDLCPRNILLDRNDHPFIADFGLAIHQDDQETRVGEVSGSLAYMAPEQIRGESQWLDGRADIWSLGVLMYELLAGRRPFVSQEAEPLASEILVREPKPLRQIDDTIPAELELICSRCLAKSTADRFATAGDIAAALRQFLEPPAPVTQRPGTGQWLPIAMMSIASCALLAVCVLFAGALPGTTPPHQVTPKIVIEVFSAEGLTQAGLYRDSIRRSHVRAVPLRYGEGVRFSIEVADPRYLYVLLVDTDGTLQPVYPWDAGDWNSFPQTEQRGRTVTLPAEQGASFPITRSSTSGSPASGVATLVVMTRRQPLGSDSALAELSRGLAAQPLRNPREVSWFSNGVLIERVQARVRGIEVSTTTPITDEVVLNQQQIQAALGDKFDVITALAFPIQEREENIHSEATIEAGGHPSTGSDNHEF